MEDDDYFIDEQLLDEGKGNKQILDAYAKLFGKIEEISKNGKNMANCGATKEISASIDSIVTIASALIDITKLDKKIIGPTGKVFNMFGCECSEEEETKNTNKIPEGELLKKIEDIVGKNTENVKFSELLEATQEMKKEQTNIDDSSIDW